MHNKTEFFFDATFPSSDPLRFRKKLLPSYKNNSNWLD